MTVLIEYFFLVLGFQKGLIFYFSVRDITLDTVDVLKPWLPQYIKSYSVRFC